MALSQSACNLPITAIQHVHAGQQEILIVGEGPYLRAFCLSTLSLKCQVRVFESQAIHGIVCSRPVLDDDAQHILCLIWGGRHLGFVQLIIERSGVTCKAIFSEKYHSDWTLDALFLHVSSNGEPRVVLLDTNNELYTFKVPDIDSHVRSNQLDLICAGPPSALYSGSLKVWTSNRLLAAVGTVFGGVHIWTVDLSDAPGFSSKLLAVYSGHEGSVFGITLCHFDFGLTVQAVIASCSDDRTLKIWPVPENLLDNEYQGSSTASQTGFGRSHEEDIALPPSASASGHLSRIWKVAGFSTQNSCGLVTFGEDATAQIWKIKISSNFDEFAMLKDEMLNLHTGKNIWAGILVNCDAGERPILVTGGADGRIVVSDLSRCLHGRNRVTSSFIYNDVEADLSLRAYCWLDYNTLLIVDCIGAVYFGQVEASLNPSQVRLKLIENIPGLAKYALVKAIGEDYALLADHNGCIYLFTKHNMSLKIILHLQRKTTFIFGVELIRNHGSQPELLIVLQCLGSNEIQVGKYSAVGSSSEAPSININTTNLPAAFVTTCAQYVSATRIALGSRKGDIIVLELNHDYETTRYGMADAVHGKEAVTSISVLSSANLILSTGRDGCFKVQRIDSQDHTLQLITIHSTRLPLGPDIEGAKIADQQLYVWGFKGTELVLWNHSTQQELFSMECGGNHRTWAFYHGQVSALAWAQAGKPQVAQLKSQTKVLQPGSHGREIKAIAIRNIHDSLGIMIATGAEDTCIRLASFDDQQKLRVHGVLPDHQAGVHKLAWSKDGKYLFSAAGKEEFFVWEVQSIPILHIGVKMIAAAPSVTDTGILRIMDFDLVENTNFTIAMVYSDSSIRLWIFDPTAQTLEMTNQAIYTTCCLTQCKILGEVLLTAASDGYLVLWKLSDLVQLSRRRVHQSSIKCLEVTSWNDRLVIASGGDDNAMALTVLDARTQLTCTSLIIPKAHAAALNALTILSLRDSRIELITASNDQQLRTWSFNLLFEDGSKTKITAKRERNVASSVADACCVATMKSEDGYQVIVAGIGLEIWDQRLQALRASNS